MTSPGARRPLHDEASPPSGPARASVLDSISAWMDAPLRPLDFTVIVALRPDATGLLSARAHRAEERASDSEDPSTAHPGAAPGPWGRAKEAKTNARPVSGWFVNRSGPEPSDLAGPSHGARPGRASESARERLVKGAESAHLRFPRSASRLEGDLWIPSAERAPIEAVPDLPEALDAFVDAPIDPRDAPQIRQLILHGPSGVRLATRCHHAAADLGSVLWWLDEQLAVASGRREAQTHSTGDLGPPTLKKHQTPVRKTAFAHAGPSTRLWSASRAPSRARRHLVLPLEPSGLRAAVPSHLGVTYNDLLGLSALDAFARHNAAHGAPTRNLALWMPVNVRAAPFEGFGNGSSRVRIYADPLGDARGLLRLRGFRAQVVGAKETGEWVAREDSPLLKLPDPLRRSLVRAYLSRPWVDMGTSFFSHAERFADGAGTDAMLAEARSIEIVAELHARYPAGLAAVTHQGTTFVSLTYDPAMWPEATARAFLALYQSVVADLARELMQCAG